MFVHPRVSLNSICSMNQSFDDDLALWAALGVDHVGLITPKLDGIGWENARRAVLDRQLRVSSVSCYKHEIERSVEFTATVGTNLLYFVPGTGGSMLWEEAAEQFCEDMAPHVARAEELGVTLALEPTNPLRTDVSFVHTFRDAADLARMAGMSVVIDFYSSWYERALEENVRKNIDIVALVQIGDYELGTFDIPNRCAVGDGDIPVERLMAMVLDAGYQGAFDLEILGPVIEAEGYRAPIARSLERASEMLDRLGA
ncbi:MAG TPA: sugar phosphate isomerase/epimerase family protein [Acidimicrobiia bacterium]|nr:sugar phosphate isomerase/epimerase family protein [Acidimicrobiia bacterium]